PGEQDTNGTDNIYLYDRLNQTTTLVSHASDSPTTTANGRSLIAFSGYALSADGRYVVYISLATDLVAGQVDSNGTYDTFLYDRLTGTNTLVTHNSTSLTTAADHGGGDQAMSADGNFIVFQSASTDLVPGQQTTSNNSADLFLYERQT